MARHLTLAAIGRGMSRHRAPRSRARWARITALGVVALVGAGLAVPQTRGPIRSAVGIAAVDGTPVTATDCSRGTTELVIASSVDKSALLTRFGEDYSRTGRDAAGRCVHVRVVVKASGAAMSELAQGWTDASTRPDVWSPSGSIWLPLLEAELAAGQRSSLLPTTDSVPTIATSPLVIAMPRPMGEAMGWPRAAIGWSDILKLGSERTGWGAFGHPEWGAFQLGKLNPNFSHAGLEGTIATYYAAVGRTSGLTPELVARGDVRRFVAGVEQSVVRYGDNTVSFSTDWLRADQAGQSLGYLSALVTEESVVAAYNEGNPTADPALDGRTTPPKVPLVAIYPKEGTFLADHPYAVLSAPWVTPEKRDAAAAFLDHLLSPGVQKAFQDNHYRDFNGTPGGLVAQSVGLLPDQPKTILAPPPAATTAAVLHSWAQLRKTANVINLLDVSGSMTEAAPGGTQSRLDAAKQAVIGSLDLFTDQDAAGLWSFSGGRRGVRDWTELVPVGPMDAAVAGRTRRDAIRTSVTALRARGDTGLYNSIGAAYNAVVERYEPQGINAIIVLTDGRNDAQGGLTLDQLLALLTTDGAGRQVRVITIAYGPDADRATLARIARATKGASYVAQGPAEIRKAYAAALSNV